MKYHEILREMSWDEAASIFRDLGVDPTLPLPELKSATKKLWRDNHPDTGGDLETMKKINAAFDVLKEPKRYNFRPSRDSRDGYSDDSGHSYQRPEETPDEPWAHAGYSGGMRNSSRINRNDYTDLNFIKKRMWELSGHSNVEWTITGFDGAFSRASTTVYGSEKIFAEMAQAIVIWQTKGGNSYPCRAVYTQKRRSKDSTVLIIWADGISYAADPIPLEYDSFNQNPSNDRHFDRHLRELIDELHANGGRTHDQPGMDDINYGPGKGKTNDNLKTFETGAYVHHKKYGVGRIINPEIRKGMARVAFKDATGNVKISSLQFATDAEQQEFKSAAASA